MPVSIVLVMLQGTAAGQVEGRGVRLGAGVLRQDVHYCHVTGQNARYVTKPTVRSRRRVVVQSGSITVNPLDRSKCFTLFALPDRPVHSDTNSTSLRSILDF